MRTFRKIRIVPLTLALFLSFTYIFAMEMNRTVRGADTSSVAGSATDPLVTLSYINDVLLPQIEKKITSGEGSSSSAGDIDTKIAASVKTALEKSIDETVNRIVDARVIQVVNDMRASGTFNSSVPSETVTPAASALPPVYEVIEPVKGQKIRSKSGVVEMILRPGSTARVVSPFLTQGLSDATSGSELNDMDTVPLNHTLLIPRADGRGLEVTSSVAYILVRGDYEIY
ncbi:hypothetical protein FACS1894105_09370 [Clostridia bacterium]|nr:hypothetical protein FACS1894105_09370 [Clostridia bacterium]